MEINYDVLKKSLFGRLKERMEMRDHPNREFAVQGTARQVLTREHLRPLFRSLGVESPPESRRISLLLDRMERRSLHDFLAVLIYVGGSASDAQRFIARLLDPDDAEWAATCQGSRPLHALPADIGTLRDIFGPGPMVENWHGRQACFCPVVLFKGEEVKVSNNDHWRLPYVEERQKGAGSFGKVYAVSVAPGHWRERRAEPGGKVVEWKVDESVWLARKDFEKSESFGVAVDSNSSRNNGQGDSQHQQQQQQQQQQHLRERDILLKILGSTGSRCENILETLGFLDMNFTYCLFMELAEFDLRQYMMEFHAPKPGTLKAKAKVLRCAEGLARGLDFLHTKLQSADGENLVCYHMDLKPSNVLVFRNTSSRGTTNAGNDNNNENNENYSGADAGDAGDMIWKISDFGMARIKISSRHGQGGGTEKDLTNWFRRRRLRPADNEPSPSGTANRRGEGTYLAPESASATAQRRTMNAQSDVWSLGCIVSVVFAYLEGGKDAVSQYSVSRASHPGTTQDSDRFFVAGWFDHFHLNPAVTRWHADLADQATLRSELEGSAVHDMLSHLERMAFQIESRKRQSAEMIQRKLRETRLIYERLAASGGTSHGALPPETSRRDRWLPKLSARREIESALPTAAVWRTDSGEAFKGCEISPGGQVIAFWTDTKIVLFPSTTLIASGDIAVAGADYTLEGSDGFCRSVTLSDRYLVASLTKSKFLARIFEMEQNDVADGYPNLNHRTLLPLPLPEIREIAISPANQTIACILQHDPDDNSPRLLFYAKIWDLITYAKEGPESFASQGGDAWVLKPMERAIEAATHLVVGGEERIYTVLRPEATATNREPKVPIIMVSFRSKEQRTVEIQSLGSDGSSTTVPFITTCAPFYNEPVCAIVTREKKLHVVNVADREPGGDVQKYIANYRVLKLMMSRDDQDMYGLGTRSASSRVVVLKIRNVRPPRGGNNNHDDDDEQGRHQPAVVDVIAEIPGLLYGDEYVARLIEDGDRRFVLIASLASGGRPRSTIFKANLP